MALPLSFTLLSLQLPNTDVSIIPTGSVTSMFSSAKVRFFYK